MPSGADGIYVHEGSPEPNPSLLQCRIECVTYVHAYSLIGMSTRNLEDLISVEIYLLALP